MHAALPMSGTEANEEFRAVGIRNLKNNNRILQNRWFKTLPATNASVSRQGVYGVEGNASKGRAPLAGSWGLAER